LEEALPGTDGQIWA